MKKIMFQIFFIGLCQLSQAGNIDGIVKYANHDSTVLRASRVILSDLLGNPIDSVYTDASGSYSFIGVDDGTYHIKISPSHPWGGVNSADALQTLRHFVGIQPLLSVQLIAADVNSNGYVNSLDALLIAKRFSLLMPDFPSGDWVQSSEEVSVNGSNSVFQTHFTLCFGDVNGSYIPDNDQFLLCGDTVTDIRDGRKYNTVAINNQCWMTQNMNIGTMLYGFDNQSNNGIIEKYCYNDDSLNCMLYGGLYQWTEMMQYTYNNGTQGLCPERFHIPTSDEWESLSDYLGGEIIAGGAMKETGYSAWDPPNTGATNISGFSSRGGGNRIGSGSFLNLNTEAKIWSSTQQNINSALYRNLYNINTSFLLNNHGKNNGLSVRCIK